MSEKEQFEQNKVLLWGEKQASSKLLKQYGVGNKNPLSKARVGKAKPDKEEREEKKEEFDPKGEYYEDDLPFLYKEYERLSNIAQTTWADEDLELEEKISDLIDQLEHLKKIRGGKLNYEDDEEEEATPDDEDDLYGSGFKSRQASLEPSGLGFKAGSPEAKAHAEKMRKAREAAGKQSRQAPLYPGGQVKTKQESKARVVKGSEEAKALGKRLAEAKKAKYAKEKEEEEEKKTKEKQSKLKPWYYIGDMPERYREATEDEAIKAGKVSEYGKYTVDETKYYYYKKYKVLLSEDISDIELRFSLLGAKKKIMKALQEIEILENKLENEKYEDRWDEFKEDLKEEKEKRKNVQAAWNWLYKLWCKRNNKQYERQNFKLPKKEVIKTESSKFDKFDFKPQRDERIDPRTGNPIWYDEELEKEENKKAELYYTFENSEQNIEIPKKYFDNDKKLISKYAFKILAKGFILDPIYYTETDRKKIFFHKTETTGGTIVKRKPDLNYNDIVQSVVFDRHFYNKETAKKWLKENNYHFDSIDINKSQIRARQYNPEDLRNRHYITKSLKDGKILLIISMRNPGEKSLPIKGGRIPKDIQERIFNEEKARELYHKLKGEYSDIQSIQKKATKQRVKKGSKEAKEWAEKMRLARLAKKK